jgi:hypothetical protein
LQQLILYLHGIAPKLVDPRRMTRALHSQMEPLVQTQMLTPIANSVVEINVTQPTLMGMMKTFPLIKSKKNLYCSGGHSS